MISPIFLPQELEGAQVFLSIWLVQVGETVYPWDRVVEVLIGGATFDVAAPAVGRLISIMAWPGEVVFAGQILGYVEEDVEI